MSGVMAIESSPDDAWERARHARPLVEGSLRWLACTAAKMADMFVHCAIPPYTQRGLRLRAPTLRTRALSLAWDDYLVLVEIGWRAWLRPTWRRSMQQVLEQQLRHTAGPGAAVHVRVVRKLPERVQ